MSIMAGFSSQGGRTGLLKGLALVGAAWAISAAAPAMAAPRQSARLVSCADGDCLLVSASRANPQARILINGHPVQAEGGRRWKALLPVETVRAWSMPGARNIAVTTLEPDKGNQITTDIKLPGGMLGNITELAYLVILQR
ncbi:hypothetical protein [Sphingobium sp. Sx8-8]|uniref:hypothetical protein n=1 Tax=Sphingobium sp. Sx8-8 TaxID=2933617 RepID=UPI001F58D4CE|nr:hypothetical protein [Sphingobium sp. Sx8-8]